MIDAQQIHARQLRAHPPQPPAEVGAAQRLPVVYRIAPQLALVGEVVRRHAPDHSRLAGGGELEQLAVRPGFHRGGADVERQIAEQPHPARACVRAQLVPLHVKGILLAFDARDFGRELVDCLRERLRRPVAQRRRPAPERRPAVRARQRLEQRVVMQPGAGGRQELRVDRRVRIGQLRGIDERRVARAVRAHPVGGPILGPVGRICHTEKPASASQSMKARPPRPSAASRADIGSSTPARRRSKTGNRMLATRASDPFGQPPVARRITPPCSGAPCPVEMGSVSSPGGARFSRRYSVSSWRR